MLAGAVKVATSAARRGAVSTLYDTWYQSGSSKKGSGVTAARIV